MNSSKESNPLDEQDNPCFLGESCRNSPQNAGELRARCHICRAAPGNEESDFQIYWRPTDKSLKHPAVEALKRQASIDRRSRAQQARQARDKTRQARLKQANRAEKTTERKIIQATKNSGRSFQDGDHLLAGRITMDTKHQSQRVHPVVNLLELAKVRRDASSAGTLFGALVLRPKNNSGIVAMAEEDFARLVSIIVAREDKDERESAEP